MRPLLYRDVHLLDLETDTGMTARCDLLTENGCIATIGQQLAPPDGAEVVEGRGHLLMPGLVNAHFQPSVNHMKGRLPCLPLELFMLYESPGPRPTPWCRSRPRARPAASRVATAGLRWRLALRDLTEALRRIEPGQRILLDDGKLDLTVLRREPWGVVAKIVGGPREKGYKLKAEKGVNFPDTEIKVPALTDEDREALRFVARHADGIGFSFVQDVEDVRLLQEALTRERPDDWRRLGLLLKIETKRAVRNLPDLLVRAAGRQPTAAMIARGDLAVEIGFARLAEMQEEILWICEAAQIPAIWATQVLESLIKTGLSSRGEMTDAAMAARAECVMLNKGPFVFEGIAEIDRLIGRMSEHIRKKTH